MLPIVSCTDRKLDVARSDRLFEIIQLLRRRKRVVTAQWIAEQLEVTPRTIYRDIAALQAMRVPIEGEVGVGYLMRSGFDLPPLTFDAEEVEAISVGLSLLTRTGDRGLVKAATRVARKIADVVPQHAARQLVGSQSQVSSYGIKLPNAIDMPMLRRAIRESTKIRIAYTNSKGEKSLRTLKPIVIFYYVEVALLVAWCEMRSDFRQFRIDRITSIDHLDASFSKEADALREKWLKSLAIPPAERF